MLRERPELLETLASAVMAARADDDDALASLADAIGALAAALGEGSEGPLKERLEQWEETTKRLRARSCDDPSAELKRIRQEMAALQDELSRQDGEREDAARCGRFVLPEWVEESVFAEFVAGFESVLEEIESDMLALEQGSSADALRSLRGRIHSLKGETGVLGLDAIEAVCHAIEDHLETDSLRVDLLLSVKDWLAEAIAAYVRGEIPEHEAMMTAIEEPVPQKHDDAHEIAPERPACDDGLSAPADFDRQSLQESACPDGVEQSADWDADTLEIVGEFLQEAGEGLTQVDGVLLAIETQGVENEQINAMFRAFHTIKGVAGFLELADIAELAHTTESMLDLGRSGDLEFAGAVLDLVFDATELMRQMLDALSQAVSQGLKPAAAPEIEGLLARLRAVIEGQVPREGELPDAQPGDRLGEVLAKHPLSVAPEAIERGLGAQESSGRRLGEELVAQGAAKPKQVAQALRAQNRAGGQAHKIKEVVKVDLERVDTLVALIGELVIVESMVINAFELAGQATPTQRKHISQMSKITRDLQDIGTRMRMVPVRGLFQKMSRMVRDLSRGNGKAISAQMDGEATEVDRSMVEQLGDPMVHMIRNAVDHGIEPSDQRKAAGKPPRGTIKLRAFHQGGSVVIQVSDDGRGLNRERIIEKAIEKGLIKEGDQLTDSEVYNLVFAPGFSTAKQVTEISGRGVGMDVVRRNIEAIRGRASIDSTPGQGSTFTMTLPLTLAIIDGMLIACGEERYIIPTLSVLESIRPDDSMVHTITGKGEVVDLRGEIFPLLRLARLLHVPNAETDPTRALVVVVESRGKKIGILVDEVLDQQQVVIKSLDASLPGNRHLSGAAIMSDGRVGLILNTDEIGSLVDRHTFAVASGRRSITPEPIPWREIPVGIEKEALI